MRSGVTSSPLAEEEGRQAAEELILAARHDGGQVRVLGGIGVALRCRSVRGLPGLARTYSDVDLVTTRKSVPALTRICGKFGYQPEHRFNALHGRSRMMFDRADGVHLDVFVDEFSMCHRLDLASRFTLHDTTVPLADLLLTKLQVAALNPKDVSDAAALLLDHDLTRDETGINVEYITNILARDWGWWKTVSSNLSTIPIHLRSLLPQGALATVTDRAEHLMELIEQAPKSPRWKVRAKVGERIPWREDPEERG